MYERKTISRSADGTISVTTATIRVTTSTDQVIVRAEKDNILLAVGDFGGLMGMGRSIELSKAQAMKLAEQLLDLGG
jgi:hypothetical protein